MLKLYYCKGTCALAGLVALEESGLAYETARVDFSKGEQRSPDFLAINPKGRVPALATDKGVITENPAILAYIAQVAPAARLAPLDDSFEFARMQSFNSYLCSTVHVNHAHGPRASRWADDTAAMAAMKAKVTQTMTESFALIEEQFLTGPWVLGDRYSVADSYLFTLARWLPGDGVEIDTFAKVSAHYARMLERPAVQRAMAAEKG